MEQTDNVKQPEKQAQSAVYLEAGSACQEGEHEMEEPLLVEKQVLLLLAEVLNEEQQEVTSGGAAGVQFAQVWL